MKFITIIKLKNVESRYTGWNVNEKLNKKPG